jgi:solute carrier family 35 (UDP-sugar transporter), member A1/2/3
MKSLTIVLLALLWLCVACKGLVSFSSSSLNRGHGLLQWIHNEVHDTGIEGTRLRRHDANILTRLQVAGEVVAYEVDSQRIDDQIASKSLGVMETLTSKKGQQIAALFTLLLQNTGMILLMRLSRMKPSANMYSTKSAVMMNELIKLITSLVLYKTTEKGSIKQLVEDSKSLEMFKIALPSALYVLQNNLQYVAVSNLPVQVYQVCIQAKIIITALLSEFMLKVRHTRGQWSSLFTLFAGLAMVQSSLNIGTATQSFVGNALIGMVAVITTCITSGCAGVYFEKMVKNKTSLSMVSEENKEKKSTLWGINSQMSFVSVIISSVAWLTDEITRNPSFLSDLLWGTATTTATTTSIKGLNLFVQTLFRGYTPLVASIIALQAFGGLIVALVVKKTNSVVKGFATSGAVVLSCLLSRALFTEFTMTPMFYVGSFIVTVSAMMFNYYKENTRKTERRP